MVVADTKAGDGSSVGWEPPVRIEKDDLVQISDELLSDPDIDFEEKEDIFRIHSNGLDWDIGNIVYEPKDPSKIGIGPDGKKLAILMLHGGASDWRSIERLARTFCGKRGYKVCNMTYPGRFYFGEPEHNWPGDTFHNDGTVRTPIWLKGENITSDQYDVKVDTSHREIYGSRRYAVSKPDSLFHVRMGAWPKAIVDAMLDICARHFPPNEWSIYVHGHSTGGPFVHTAMQRVENIRGLIGIENSPFGQFFNEMTKHDWPTPFNYVLIRDWRELARYKGAELALEEGEKPLFRLAQVMEELYEQWEQSKRFPQFKAENWYHNRTPSCLVEAANVASKYQGFNKEETEALIDEYLNYGVPLEGEGVKPVPNLLHGICDYSRDHTVPTYEFLTERYAQVKPSPRFRYIQLGTGVHSYWRTEDGLPLGVCPIVTKVWHEAIMNGYFEQ